MVQKIAIVGCGHYTMRHHVDLIDKNRRNGMPELELVSVFDVSDKREELFSKTNKLGIHPEFYQVPHHLSGSEFKQLLDKDQIDAVVIATDPLAHEKYIRWSLEEGKKVLLDKPIVALKNTSVDENQARKLFSQYCTLENLANSNTLVGTQRRFDPYYRYMIDASEKFPANHMFIQKTDGQIRTLEELFEMKYHGFTEGYGAIMHTGYHLIDMIALVMKDQFDSVKVLCDVSRPRDYLAGPYQNFLGDENVKNQEIPTGEMDATVHYSFYKNGFRTADAIMSLMHTSPTDRTWKKSRSDLYKGNGRKGNECIRVIQGPHQGITSLKVEHVGQDMTLHRLQGHDKISISKVNSRELMWDAFLQEEHSTISDIESHKKTMYLVSLAYISAARAFNNQNPYVEARFPNLPEMI
jgi:predicted dehydrogenase